MFYHWLIEALFHHRAFVFSGQFCPKTLGSTKMELGHFPTCSRGCCAQFPCGFSGEVFRSSKWACFHALDGQHHTPQRGQTTNSKLATLFVNLTFLQTFTGACLVHQYTWKTIQVVLSRAGQLWSPQSFSEALVGVPGTKHRPVLNTLKTACGPIAMPRQVFAPHTHHCHQWLKWAGAMLWWPMGCQLLSNDVCGTLVAFCPLRSMGRVWLRGVTRTKWPVMEKEEKDWAWEMPCAMLQSLDVLPLLSENFQRCSERISDHWVMLHLIPFA